ncbi:hypothetical protein DPEC_G00182370 [Dallia pectoralis]|uniref:Uncharacterized protein n=1 Tax=Dallia pectoralis TaxID=75939 RepID=A0ACC2GAH9_DALPE|nr:hypothetical protein DPEC_G00182370 [Dallia pectoralis]
MEYEWHHTLAYPPLAFAGGIRRWQRHEIQWDRRDYEQTQLSCRGKQRPPHRGTVEVSPPGPVQPCNIGVTLNYVPPLETFRLQDPVGGFEALECHHTACVVDL